MPPFVPGLVLAKRFYNEVVDPLLDGEFPGIRHSAALIGSGSEVLGFDTEMSADHDWGPRMQLFLAPDEYVQTAPAVDHCLTRGLPRTFLGYSTDFGDADNTTGTIHHRVKISTVHDFFGDYLGINVAHAIEPADWFTFPQQKLRAITAGAVFHDDLGLQAVRDRFAWYPHDVWLYMLAAGWTRIGQEDHLMGRAGFVGDELGSALIGSRLVRDLMQLCFLIERQYAPYAKWFGTAFARLKCAPELTPILQRAQSATTWQERQAHFLAACEHVAAMHTALGIIGTVPARVTPFFTRPYRVLNTQALVEATLAGIEGATMGKLAASRLIGNIDQFSDSTDLREDVGYRAALKALYQ